MTFTSSQYRQVIRTLILLATVSAAAFANPSMGLLTGVPTPLCYCRCEHENPGHKCTKMCELPQYEKKWWATSCHKKAPAIKEEQPSNSHSRKTNRAEEALL
jgi:hypothetical protein